MTVVNALNRTQDVDSLTSGVLLGYCRDHPESRKTVPEALIPHPFWASGVLCLNFHVIIKFILYSFMFHPFLDYKSCCHLEPSGIHVDVVRAPQQRQGRPASELGTGEARAICGSITIHFNWPALLGPRNWAHQWIRWHQVAAPGTAAVVRARSAEHQQRPGRFLLVGLSMMEMFYAEPLRTPTRDGGGRRASSTTSSGSSGRDATAMRSSTASGACPGAGLACSSLYL